MEIDLKENNKILKTKFSLLKNKHDIADILEIKEKDLIYCLYRVGVDNYYKEFEIEKRNGGKRKISSPQGSLKILQSKLNYILQLIYKPRECVQGFVPNRSIVTNANKHFGARFLLNIDIEDFFSSINFGRIRGLFLHKPFSFNKDVSTILAQICCYKNGLPQGAPTSPIIANLICYRFDTRMIQFAKKNRLFYTRYADDITLSSKIMFKKNIIRFRGNDFSFPVLSNETKNIFKENGFAINKEKTHFSTKSHRQKITGIIINKKINTSQKFIRQVRAMLHAWEKYGLDNAEKEFYHNYNKKYVGVDVDNLPQFSNIVFGKINYIRMVRGYQDKIFRKYYNQYITLTRHGKILPVNNVDIINEITYIIEVEGAAEQGTVFYTKEYGWVTNYHVIKNSKDDIVIYSSSGFDRKKASIVKEFPESDLAILSIEGLIPENYLEINNSYKFNNNEAITVCGYPEHNIFDSIYMNSGKIVSTRHKNSIEHYVFDKPIIKGNSGGPVLNHNDEIVGVASTGSTFAEADETMFFGIIPISNLKDIVDTDSNK